VNSRTCSSRSDVALGAREAGAMATDVDLTTYVLEFGKKHRGERIARVRAGYLLWMVQERAGPWEVAQLELDRRGISLPQIDLSSHAVDTASLRIRKTWHENREKAEGLHSWLCRAAIEAIEKGEKLEAGVYLHLEVKWVVAMDGEWPTLKTVIPAAQPGRPPGAPTETYLKELPS
jgi:hypothetical protein